MSEIAAKLDFSTGPFIDAQGDNGTDTSSRVRKRNSDPLADGHMVAGVRVYTKDAPVISKDVATTRVNRSVASEEKVIADDAYVSEIKKTSQNTLVYFETVAQWRGKIVDINDDIFTSWIILQGDDGHDSAEEREYVDFSISEVPENNRQYIQKGACFSWHIGKLVPYRQEDRLKMGTVKNENIFRFEFNKFPALTKDTLKKMRDEAEDLAQYLD